MKSLESEISEWGCEARRKIYFCSFRKTFIKLKLSVMNNGRDFEVLIARIEKALSDMPGVRVLHNIKMPDSNGGLRQIDVLIIDERERFPYKTIVECKNTKAKVDINTVEAFKALIRSVNAHQGIIVSANGFQSGAFRAAKDSCVHLYQLSQSKELENYLREFRIGGYELRHESKDIVVGFNAPTAINGDVTSKSSLFSSFLERPVSISDIATNFLESQHQQIVDVMFRSVIDPFKAQKVIGSTQINIVFPAPFNFEKNGLHTEVAGFRAIVETTLTTSPGELQKVSTYTDMVKAKTEALVFELKLDGKDFQWIGKAIGPGQREEGS